MLSSSSWLCPSKQRLCERWAETESKCHSTPMWSVKSIIVLTVTANGGKRADVVKPPQIQKEDKLKIMTGELLAQVRIKKKAKWLHFQSQAQTQMTIWPFWRKKKADLAGRAMTRRITDLTRKRQLDQVFTLVETAVNSKKPLNIIIMNAVVAACVHCHDVERAMCVFEEMQQPGGCGVDCVTYGTLLKGLGDARRLDEAFELIEAMEAGTAPGRVRLSDVHLNTLVNACVEAGDIRRARGVLQRYRSSANASPSTLTYNLLIKGCSRSENPLEALKLKEEMLMQDLQPQRLTYNSLILACIRGGEMEKALYLVTEMKAEARRLKTSRLLPDVVTYTTLLKGWADQNKRSGVLELVSEMKSSPTCVLDRVAYSAIIDACISVEAYQEAMECMEEMKEKAKVDTRYRPKAHVYLSFMRAFARTGNVEMVKSLRKQMVTDSAGHVWPEDRTEADELLVEAAVNAGQLGLAKQAVKIMVGFKKGIPLSSRATMVVVRLQAQLGFCNELFKPHLFLETVSPYDTIEKFMTLYDQARPLLGSLLLKNVAMRFFKEDVVPIVDEQGACIGAVHSEDCTEMEAHLCDITRGIPPMVATSTLVGKVANMLLESKTRLLVVVNNRTMNSGKENTLGKPLGFVTRKSIFLLK